MMKERCERMEETKECGCHKKKERTEKEYKDFYNNFYTRGKKSWFKWNKMLKEYKNKYISDYENLMKCLDGELDYCALNDFEIEKDKEIASRDSSKTMLNHSFFSFFLRKHS